MATDHAEPARRWVKVIGYVRGDLIPAGMFDDGEPSGLDDDGCRYVGRFQVEDLQDLELTTEESPAGAE